MGEQRHRCKARVLPLQERRMRECGYVATEKVGEEWFCPRHAKVRRARAEEVTKS